MLQVRDLHAYYGQSHILHGVNIDVQEGEIVSLLGRNGVGRTATCKAINASGARVNAHTARHGIRRKASAAAAISHSFIRAPANRVPRVHRSGAADGRHR